MCELTTPLNTEICRGLNLTGYPNPYLINLGFETFSFELDKSKKIEEEVLKGLSEIIDDFRRIYIVLPHFRPSIAYTLFAIREITGQPPVIVYLKPDPSADFKPRLVDLRQFQKKCRKIKAQISQNILDKK